MFLYQRDTSILNLVLSDNLDIVADALFTANFSTSDHASTLFNLYFVET